jgi:hypothetical protein
MREFIYYLKLHNGKLLHSKGSSLETAARRARVKLSAIKRHMPVKAILTKEERLARAKKFLQLRQRRSKP